MSELPNHLGSIWYHHSEPSNVTYSENLPRPISWFGLFLQQNESSENFRKYKELKNVSPETLGKNKELPALEKSQRSL